MSLWEADFFVRAMLAGIGLAVITGPAGCFVVWRRLSYFGETIAHTSLLGVALAIAFDLNLVICILAGAFLVATIMFHLERHGLLPTDTLLGLMAHGGMALGLIFLSFLPFSGFSPFGIFIGQPTSALLRLLLF